MARVTAPPHGRLFRISKKGYVEGLFMVDGKRLVRNLCRFEELERSESGRRRTDDQVSQAVRPLWAVKRDALEEDLGGDAGETQTMRAVFDEWVQAARRRERDHDTVRDRELCRDLYLATVGDHPVEERLPKVKRLGYDLAHAAAFLDALKAHRWKRGRTGKELAALGTARINAYLGLLRSALRFAEQQGWLARAPSIEKLTHDRGRARVPKHEQMRAMRTRLIQLSRKKGDTLKQQRKKGNTLKQQWYRLHRLWFYLLLLTGTRPGEAIALKAEQIDLERRAIPLFLTKTGTPRIIRLPRFLVGKIRAHLAAHPDAVWLFEHPRHAGQPAWNSVAESSRAMARHMEALGFKGQFKPQYGYRAGFATSGLNDLGISAAAIRDQVGHTDLQTTMAHYVAGMGEAQLGAVDAIERRFFPRVRRKIGGKPSQSQAQSEDRSGF